VTPELLISIRVDGDACVVMAAGEVDMASAPQLSDALADVHGRVILDLARVTFLDSSGINVLVRARNRLRAESGDLTIRNPQDNVRAVLKVVGLASWIE
jgi:stage II sporulation protein AA (anti-sigma F factor antagonist)